MGVLFAGNLKLLPLASIKIETPRQGDVLQGVVTVIGSAKVNAFSSYELLFAYDEEKVDTWFLLAQRRETIEFGNLGTWDTTTIADGNYQLKLVVYLLSGKQEEEIIRGLRVRNYSPVETGIPAGVLLPAATQAPVVTPTMVRVATPTHLAANPAGIDKKRVWNSLVLGVSIAFFAIASLSLIFWLRGVKRR